MERLTNDENIKNLVVRKKLRLAIIILGLITIVLAILDLYYRNWFLLGGAVISFLISTYLTKKRDKIQINKRKELQEIENITKSNKKAMHKGR